MLISLDSCSAVARAIVTARVGRRRAVAIALIVAALAACSVLSVYGELLMSQLADCGIGSLSVIHERTANAAAVTRTPMATRTTTARRATRVPAMSARRSRAARC